MNFNIKSLLVILFVVVALWALSACEEAEGNQTEASSENVNLVNVQVEKLTGGEFTDFVSVVGTVKPVNSANLSYLPGGIVKEIRIDKGQYALKGDTIAVIDNDVLIANYKAGKAKYELAQITFEKQEQIYKQNVGSEFQYLQAKLNRDAAKASYELMKAQLADTYIIAPFNGTVDYKFYEVGELAAPGTPIVRILSNKKLKIEAGVPEIYFGKIHKGVNAKIYFENIAEPVTGKVVFIGESVISSNRTFPIEIDINTSIPLKSEMLADVYLEIEKYNNVITVPDEVVTRSDHSYTVFVAKNKTAVRKDIEILKRYKNRVAIKSGLTEGDSLIVIGYQNLVDGEKINIVK